MDKLICNNCKTELTVDNIKDIIFDRDVAYILCKNCNRATETDNETGSLLRFNLVGRGHASFNSDILYNFEDLEYLLEQLLSDTDREKIRDCKFTMHEEYPDDDSGAVYYYITIYKDDNEIGKIDMYYSSNTYWDLIENEYVTDTTKEPSYTYTLKWNSDKEPEQESYLECKKCHNKILGNYWLNVKYQGHYNYGDYEEDIYTGVCPICGETIETSELGLYTNSMEAEETELQQYYKVIGNFGYEPFPFEGCDYSDTCAAEELKYIKNELESLTDILNVKYLYNIDNIKAIQSNKAYKYTSAVIRNIFHNTDYADFNINSVKDCEFRVLDCSSLNESVEDNIFDTPIISLLLQVIRNNKIIGYIKVEQQYPLDKKFVMFEVKKDSNKRLVELCNAYTNMYNSEEDTPIMLSKARTDGLNAPVCKKCGQLFCDCNLRCPICGKVFCEHKYRY